MGVYVAAMDRGGFAARGGCYYDARDRVVRLQANDPDDALPVTVEFNQTPTEVAFEENGISSTTPSISGNSVSIVFQALNPGGRYKLITYFALGSSTLHFEASQDQARSDGAVTSDIDYGAWSA